ncbi:MAG: glycosyltransferase family 2 protein [Chloroflexota bacterium]|nr:glycosyltransferase family 2 protein [Chloroflexota bacterium]
MLHSLWRTADRRNTLIINGVTLGVAAGLLANARHGATVPAGLWPPDLPAPPVCCIVPMRDEITNVAGCLAGVLAQRYPHFTVIVVDDGSTDGTGAALAAIRDPRLRVISGAPLPPGWTGKTWALAQGCAAADPAAVWLLTLDADMRLEPTALASAVAYAARRRADLLTLLPDLELHTFWEKLLVPHAGELYTLLVGALDRVNDTRSPVASANGQFILLRRTVYDALGGWAAVRGEVAEDWALARRVKGAGYRLLMAQGRAVVRARVYAGLGDLWAGYSKTLFPAGGRSLARVAAVILLLTLYGVLPPLRLLAAVVDLARRAHSPAHDQERLALALAQVGPLLAVRAVLSRSLGLSPWLAFTYPLAILLGDAMLLWSAWRYRSGRGMTWKGRRYG